MNPSKIESGPNDQPQARKSSTDASDNKKNEVRKTPSDGTEYEINSTMDSLNQSSRNFSTEDKEKCQAEYEKSSNQSDDDDSSVGSSQDKGGYRTRKQKLADLIHEIEVRNVNWDRLATKLIGKLERGKAESLKLKKRKKPICVPRRKSAKRTIHSTSSSEQLDQERESATSSPQTLHRESGISQMLTTDIPSSEPEKEGDLIDLPREGNLLGIFSRIIEVMSLRQTVCDILHYNGENIMDSEFATWNINVCHAVSHACKQIAIRRGRLSGVSGSKSHQKNLSQNEGLKDQARDGDFSNPFWDKELVDACHHICALIRFGREIIGCLCEGKEISNQNLVEPTTEKGHSIQPQYQDIKYESEAKELKKSETREEVASEDQAVDKSKESLTQDHGTLDHSENEPILVKVKDEDLSVGKVEMKQEEKKFNHPHYEELIADIFEHIRKILQINRGFVETSIDWQLKDPAVPVRKKVEFLRKRYGLSVPTRDTERSADAVHETGSFTALQKSTESLTEGTATETEDVEGIETDTPDIFSFIVKEGLRKYGDEKVEFICPSPRSEWNDSLEYAERIRERYPLLFQLLGIRREMLAGDAWKSKFFANRKETTNSDLDQSSSIFLTDGNISAEDEASLSPTQYVDGVQPVVNADGSINLDRGQYYVDIQIKKDSADSSRGVENYAHSIRKLDSSGHSDDSVHSDKAIDSVDTPNYIDGFLDSNTSKEHSTHQTQTLEKSQEMFFGLLQALCVMDGTLTELHSMRMKLVDYVGQLNEEDVDDQAQIDDEASSDLVGETADAVSLAQKSKEFIDETRHVENLWIPSADETSSSHQAKENVSSVSSLIEKHAANAFKESMKFGQGTKDLTTLDAKVSPHPQLNEKEKNSVKFRQKKRAFSKSPRLNKTEINRAKFRLRRAAKTSPKAKKKKAKFKCMEDLVMYFLASDTGSTSGDLKMLVNNTTKDGESLKDLAQIEENTMDGDSKFGVITSGESLDAKSVKMTSNSADFKKKHPQTYLPQWVEVPIEDSSQLSLSPHCTEADIEPIPCFLEEIFTAGIQPEEGEFAEKFIHICKLLNIRFNMLSSFERFADLIPLEEKSSDSVEFEKVSSDNSEEETSSSGSSENEEGVNKFALDLRKNLVKKLKEMMINYEIIVNSDEEVLEPFKEELIDSVVDKNIPYEPSAIYFEGETIDLTQGGEKSKDSTQDDENLKDLIQDDNPKDSAEDSGKPADAAKSNGKVVDSAEGSYDLKHLVKDASSDVNEHDENISPTDQSKESPSEPVNADDEFNPDDSKEYSAVEEGNLTHLTPGYESTSSTGKEEKSTSTLDLYMDRLANIQHTCELLGSQVGMLVHLNGNEMENRDIEQPVDLTDSKESLEIAGNKEICPKSVEVQEEFTKDSTADEKKSSNSFEDKDTSSQLKLRDLTRKSSKTSAHIENTSMDADHVTKEVTDSIYVEDLNILTQNQEYLERADGEENQAGPLGGKDGSIESDKGEEHTAVSTEDEESLFVSTEDEESLFVSTDDKGGSATTIESKISAVFPTVDVGSQTEDALDDDINVRRLLMAIRLRKAQERLEKLEQEHGKKD